MQLSEILSRAQVNALEVLDEQIDIPVVTGKPQPQGDLLVRFTPDAEAAVTPIPKSGTIVVKSENGGNTHIVHSWDGSECFYDERVNGQRLGVLTVPEGSSAYLVHTGEHGANGIGPGTYTINRQREWASEWRMVAD